MHNEIRLEFMILLDKNVATTQSLIKKRHVQRNATRVFVLMIS